MPPRRKRNRPHRAPRVLIRRSGPWCSLASLSFSLSCLELTDTAGRARASEDRAIKGRMTRAYKGIPLFRTDKKAAKALQASNHQRPAVTARCNVQANKYRRRDAIRHMVVRSRARIAATELGVGKGRGERAAIWAI